MTPGKETYKEGYKVVLENIIKEYNRKRYKIGQQELNLIEIKTPYPVRLSIGLDTKSRTTYTAKGIPGQQKEQYSRNSIEELAENLSNLPGYNPQMLAQDFICSLKKPLGEFFAKKEIEGLEEALTKHQYDR